MAHSRNHQKSRREVDGLRVRNNATRELLLMSVHQHGMKGPTEHVPDVITFSERRERIIARIDCGQMTISVERFGDVVTAVGYWH